MNLVKNESGPKVSLSMGYGTDVGRRRENNEDAILAVDLATAGAGQVQVLALGAVADGMGGAAAGEIASQLALQTLLTELRTRGMEQGTGAEGTGMDYGELLKGAVQQANRAVLQAAREKANHMGTTLTAALVVGCRAYVVNVGDSRTYLLSSAGMQKITHDHSVVQMLADAGAIAESEVRTHPQRNQITRAIGVEPEVEVDLFMRDLKPGDSLLLCSDGLWEMVEDAETQRIVAAHSDPQAAARALIDAANANGGADNISCILLTLTNQASS